jgi:hypothetical protein
MYRIIGTVMLALVASLPFGSASAQTMPDKWDQKCLDEASKRFIACMASATSEPAKQRCQDTMDQEKKRCIKVS